jgi:hypothetical protein
MAKMFPVDTGTVKSYLLVADYKTFAEWLVGDYRVGGADHRMFSNLCDGKEVGKKGSEIVALINTEAERQLRRYFTASLGPALDAANQAAVFNNLPRGIKSEVEAITNYTKPQVTTMNNIKKGVIVTNVGTWGDSVAKAFIAQHVTGTRVVAAAVDLPDAPEADGEVSGYGGVACAVYANSAQVGGVHKVVRGAQRENHAEMKWKAASGATLIGELYNGIRVDFHITEQPCSGYCAGELITWWKANATAQHKAYIYTYVDTDGRKHVYRLTGDSILRVGTW